MMGSYRVRYDITMTQRSAASGTTSTPSTTGSAGNAGPWRAIADEAAATAAASARAMFSGTSSVINGGRNNMNNYSDESRFNNKSYQVSSGSGGGGYKPTSIPSITVSHHKQHSLSSSSNHSSTVGRYTPNGELSACSIAVARHTSTPTSARSPAAITTAGTTIDTSDEEDDDDGDEAFNHHHNNYTGDVDNKSRKSSTGVVADNNGRSSGPISTPTATATAAKLDRYGFYISEKGISEDLGNLSLVEITRKREAKWLHMFQHWDEYIHKKWKKLRSRCRKGIPDSVRGKAWFYLCAGHKQKQRNPDLFYKLDSQPGDEKINEEIRKDLNRQFPSHEMFAQENGSGQEDLYRILKAFSVIKPDIGYCQGQAPLASVLLMQMPAEDAFWCLLQICDHYVPGYFSPGLEAIQLHGQMLSSFIKKFHPAIYKLFKRQKIDPVLYMTEWFMCFFSRTLSWPCVLRVWDMFFCEGIVVIFKVAIILISSVLGRHEDRVKCVSAYETLYALKNIPPKFLTDEYLIERVISMDLSEKDLQKEHKEQSLKRKKERERLVKERSHSLSTATGNNKGSISHNTTTGSLSSTHNKSSSSAALRNRSRAKSDYDGSNR